MVDKHTRRRGAMMEALFFAVVCIGIWISGGRVEGMLYPVTENAEITQVAPLDYGWSHIWGVFDKVRDCEFRRVEAYYTANGQSVGVQLVFDEGNRIRVPGRETFGPWRVQVTPDQIGQLEVRVFHQCHPIWETETRFYP